MGRSLDELRRKFDASVNKPMPVETPIPVEVEVAAQKVLEVPQLALSRTLEEIAFSRLEEGVCPACGRGTPVLTADDESAFGTKVCEFCLFTYDSDWRVFSLGSALAKKAVKYKKPEYTADETAKAAEALAARHCPSCHEDRSGHLTMVLSPGHSLEMGAAGCGTCMFSWNISEPLTDVVDRALAHRSAKAAEKISKSVAWKSKFDRSSMPAARYSFLKDDDGVDDAVLMFGKHNGKEVSALCDDEDGRSYLRWMQAEGGFPPRLLEVIRQQLGKKR